MAELKTKLNDKDVHQFISGIADEQKRADCLEILGLMSEVTGCEPKMWGDSIVGFGTYHYKGKSGREGDWFLTGFSPRKQNISIYIMSGFSEMPELMNKLGKFKTGSGCLYVNKLTDVDKSVLRQVIKQSVDFISKMHKSE